MMQIVWSRIKWGGFPCLGFLLALGTLFLLETGQCWATVEQKSLAQLMESKRFISLNGNQPKLQATWQIPVQEQAVHSTLALHYFVGPSTAPGTELVIALNGKDVGAVRENPDYPQGELTVLLEPGELGGGNQILSIALRSPKGIIGDSVKGWTQIDAYESQLQFRLQPKPWRTIQFNDLQTLFQRDQNASIPLPVVFLGRISPILIQAAQQAVAGIAMRTDKTVAVRVFPNIAQATARSAPLILLLGAQTAEGTSKVSGSDARVLLRPVDDSRTALVLSFTGRNDDAVLRAAQAFAQNRGDLPLGDNWQIGLVDTKTAGRPNLWRGQPVLQPGGVAKVGRVEQIDASLVGGALSLLHFSFWMPGGQFADRQKQMTLDLNLAVDPGRHSGQRPLVIVRANGNWISQWKLGTGVGHYTTTVPFSALVAGVNRLSLDVHGAHVKILPGSTMRLPKTHQYAHLPNLQLLARTAFPLVRDGNAKSLRMIYLNSTSEMLSAGLTLFAKLAQVSRSTLPAAVVFMGHPLPGGGSQVILGTPADLKPAGQINVPVQFVHGALRWQSPGSGSQWTSSQNPSARAYLLETPAGKGSEYWNLWFLIPSAESAESAADLLVQKDNWSSLIGDFAWLDAHDHYHSVMLGKQQIYGNHQNSWYWIYLFSLRPIWWVIVVLTILFLGSISAGWLSQHRRKQWGAHG